MSFLFEVKRLLVALTVLALLAVAWRQQPVEFDASEQPLDQQTQHTIDILKRRASMRAEISRQVGLEVLTVEEGVAIWRELNELEPRWTANESFEFIAEKIVRNIDNPRVKDRKLWELKNGCAPRMAADRNLDMADTSGQR